MPRIKHELWLGDKNVQHMRTYPTSSPSYFGKMYKKHSPTTYNSLFQSFSPSQHLAPAVPIRIWKKQKIFKLFLEKWMGNSFALLLTRWLILSSTIRKISATGQWYFFSLDESLENSTDGKKVWDLIWSKRLLGRRLQVLSRWS